MRASQSGRKSGFLVCVSSTRNAGSAVIISAAATRIQEGFRISERLKHPAFLPFQHYDTGRNDTAITKRVKKLGPPTSFTA